MSHKNYPDLEVYKAVRISASIPILFKPVIFEGDYYLDGGLVDPCSLNYFKNSKETLGLMVNSKKKKKISNITDFLFSLVGAPIQKVAEDYFDKPNVIIYDNSNKEGLDFEIKSDKITELIKLGHQITNEEIGDILDYFNYTSH